MDLLFFASFYFIYTYTQYLGSSLTTSSIVNLHIQFIFTVVKQNSDSNDTSIIRANESIDNMDCDYNAATNVSYSQNKKKQTETKQNIRCSYECGKNALALSLCHP